MAEQLGTLAACLEDVGSVPHTHEVTHNQSEKSKSLSEKPYISALQKEKFCYTLKVMRNINFLCSFFKQMSFKKTLNVI